jgi:hypothetical protein
MIVVLFDVYLYGTILESSLSFVAKFCISAFISGASVVLVVFRYEIFMSHKRHPNENTGSTEIELPSHNADDFEGSRRVGKLTAFLAASVFVMFPFLWWYYSDFPAIDKPALKWGLAAGVTIWVLLGVWALVVSFRRYFCGPNAIDKTDKEISDES